MMSPSDRWNGFLRECSETVSTVNPWLLTGRLTRVAGLVMEAVGLRLAEGGRWAGPLPGGHNVDAEVVGFSGEKLFLMPATDVYGLVPGARVTPVDTPVQRVSRLGGSPPLRRRSEDRVRQVQVGNELLVRILDGA